MNDVINVISNRMSLRKYEEKKISKEHLDIIIESAMRAPTAGNMMMYSVIIVEDEEKKKKISKTCDDQPFIAKAPTVLLFLADMQRWYDYFDYSNVKDYCERNNKKYAGPGEGDFVLAIEDTMIAAQNAVIAAESLGIGSCYIGDIIENYEIHKEMFNLPKWVVPVGMLCMGYYPGNYNRIIQPRFDRKYIVFNEEYNRLKDEDFADMFKDKKVAKENIYKAENFGQYMYGRKIGSDFSKEMTRSIKVMLENWKEK
ncbi:FMN reductase [NAD(P)H] [compost metagenome]